MVRTSVNSKDLAGSSGSVKRKRAPRKATKGAVIESEEEDVPMEETVELKRDAFGAIIWAKSIPLSRYPVKEQKSMYYRKIGGSRQSREKQFLYERRVNLTDFGRFGVEECFARLGWLESLRYNNHDKNVVYSGAINIWMSTLRKEDGNNPPVTTKLIGTVNKKDIVLSFETISGLGSFDAGATQPGDYYYPSEAELEIRKIKEGPWLDMIKELFHGEPIVGRRLTARELKIFPRLLLTFVQSNVMPRVSDLLKVRFREVLVLFALVTGSPKLSSRHMILYNVWKAREKQDLIVTPHARLLSELMLKYGGVVKSQHTVEMVQAEYNQVEIERGTSEWRYGTTGTKFILSNDYERMVVRREDLDSDVEMSEDEVEGGSPPPMFGAPTVTGLAPNQESSAYATHLQESMLQARPAVFESWPDYAQHMFDRQSQDLEEQRLFRYGLVTHLQERQNEEYRYNEWKRNDMDYQRGYNPVQRPLQADWGRLPSFASTRHLPRYAQSTPSRYISPYPQQTQSQPESSSGGAYDMHALSHSLFESILGTPYQPPPYDG